MAAFSSLLFIFLSLHLLEFRTLLASAYIYILLLLEISLLRVVVYIFFSTFSIPRFFPSLYGSGKLLSQFCADIPTRFARWFATCYPGDLTSGVGIHERLIAHLIIPLIATCVDIDKVS